MHSKTITPLRDGDIALPTAYVDTNFIEIDSMKIFGKNDSGRFPCPHAAYFADVNSTIRLQRWCEPVLKAKLFAPRILVDTREKVWAGPTEEHKKEGFTKERWISPGN